MDEIYVPNCASFQNDNTFLGSYHGLRFKLTPNTGEGTLRGELWHGAKCYELSEMELAETFPITPEGIDAVTAWLLEHVEA